MKLLFRHTAFIFALLLLIGCEEKKQWDLDENAGQTVIDGLLTSEFQQQVIRVQRTVPGINNTIAGLTGADIRISDGEKVFTFHEDSSTRGTYYSDSAFAAVVGKTYILNAFANDVLHLSAAEVFPITPLDSLNYRYDEERNLFQLQGIADVYTNQPFMQEIVLNWSHVPGKDTLELGTDSMRILAFAFNTMDVSQVFSPQREQVWFPKGTIITQRKYSLSTYHADYMRAVVAETYWRGGMFDVESNTLPTNISNGGLGFFAASTVIKRTQTIIE